MPPASLESALIRQTCCLLGNVRPILTGKVKLSLTRFNTGAEIQSAVANGEADLGIGFDFTKDGNLKVCSPAPSAGSAR